MYIKLTKLDGSPIWLNASFIVTIEPRRNASGAVVVPIGDGLDYDVRESPADVLRMLEGAPAPAVVPVPVSDCLTATPEDASSGGEQPPAQEEVKAAAGEETSAEPIKPKKRAARTKKAAKEDAKKKDETKEDTKPKAKAKTKGKTDEGQGKGDEGQGVREEEKAETPEPARIEPTLGLSENEVLRLRKMSPKSIGKLMNTLVKQFKIADAESNVAALEQMGVFKLEGTRVLWNPSDEPQ